MSGVREGRIELKVSGERVRHRLSIAARRSTFTKRSQEVLWHQSVSNLVQPSFTKSSLAELITARPHWIASCAISCWRDFGKGALSLASPSLHGRNTAHELITIVTYDRRTIPPCLKRGRKKSGRTAAWFLWMKKQSLPRISVVWSRP
jgi:hypothetical protein